MTDDPFTRSNDRSTGRWKRSNNRKLIRMYDYKINNDRLHILIDK